MKKGRVVSNDWNGGPVPTPRAKTRRVGGCTWKPEILARMDKARAEANASRKALGLPLIRDDEIPPYDREVSVDSMVDMASLMCGLPIVKR